MRKHFLFTFFISLVAMTAWATTIGPQSLRTTFSGATTEGWTKSNQTGTNIEVAGGYANVTIGIQNVEQKKYRCDLSYTSEDFTFDKDKDIIWAIKLSADVAGNHKFRMQYELEDGSLYEMSDGQAMTRLDCKNGKIYYYNMSTTVFADHAPKPENAHIGYISFVFADGVFENAEDAYYSVDWIASFKSVEDLTVFKNWNDDEQADNPALPYYEVGYRPKTDGSAHNKGPFCGFTSENLEANYYAQLFVVEYFLVEDFNDGKVFTLELTKGAEHSHSQLAVWDFPYQVDSLTYASTIKEKVEEVYGVKLDKSAGSLNPSICTADFSNNKWTFTIPAYKLTPIVQYGTKTLVALLVSTTVYNADNNKGLFASGCNATVDSRPSFTQTGINAIINTTNVDKKQWSAYETLASAVSAASTDDVITLFGDITVSGSRMDIAKALTIQGATGEEKITCGVAANSMMILANGNEEDHTLTFKDLIIDGNNVERSIQTLEAAQKAHLCLNNVSFVNTSYSLICGDVKNTGNKNVILQGVNSIPNGIYLNMNKRVKHEGATHTSPIKIVLANDYVPETYSIVLTCSDPTLYTAELANGTAWQLFKKDTQNELAGRTMPAHSYDLTVTAAGMATLVLGYDCPIPDGMKAYKLTNEGEADIYAKEQTSIKKNEPVLIIADADTYTFTSAVGVRLDEQADPVSGCLRGTYSESPVAVLNNDGAGTYNYILTKVGEEVGFFHANSDGTNKVSKNHAYLFTTYNATGMASAPKMRIVFHDQTATGIEDVPSADKAEKLLIDGVIYIRKADHLYRIDGQLVK